MVEAMEQLGEQNGELEKQNRDLMNQIASLRQVLAKQAGGADATQKEAIPATDSTTGTDSAQSQESSAASKVFSSEEEPSKWGAYTPNFGYQVVNNQNCDLN